MLHYIFELEAKKSFKEIEIEMQNEKFEMNTSNNKKIINDTLNPSQTF